MRNLPQYDHMINDKHWFAVYTYFRREKSAITSLKKSGIECFIPLLYKTKKYERKIKQYQVPLINHYIFVNIGKKDFTTVLQCRDVIRFIKFGPTPTEIPEKEIAILKRISGDLSIKSIDSVRPNRIGQEVEIISGNLVGIKGTLVQMRNNKQVLIDLNQIGYSIKLEIHISALSLTQKPALSAV